MEKDALGELFTGEVLETLFPSDRTERFFAAMFGDPKEGSYDIRLKFAGIHNNRLKFEFHLQQKPGKCLVCNLTYGLPGVFSRHPVIDLDGLVNEIDKIIEGRAKCSRWHLGNTTEISNALHIVPLNIFLEE
jgi:hypothetical protein